MDDKKQPAPFTRARAYLSHNYNINKHNYNILIIRYYNFENRGLDLVDSFKV